LNYFGEQKGVDLRLALDLVGLARTGSVRTAYLISGDDDLTEAVEEAQSLGLKVVLLGIPDESARLGYSSVADHLAVTVDSIMSIPEDLLNSTFTRTYTADDERAKTASAIASAEVRPAPEVVAVEASEEPIVESASSESCEDRFTTRSDHHPVSSCAAGGSCGSRVFVPHRYDERGYERIRWSHRS
jgi:hypothetical protein